MKLSSLVKWPYWKFRRPWPDHVRQFDYLDWETQRRLTYQQIDKGRFGYWTVLVAGAGFLTDAYDIFAVNTVLPMLNYVYWKNEASQNNTVLINLSLLAGTMIGQLIFGVLGDRYGRRRLYGWELLVLTVATFFMTIASKGALQSTSRVAWIAAWRFFMGVGIGGDYPLSAVITAEFAPRRHRGKMLATLFYMQACGAFIANIVTIIAVTSLQNSIPTNDVTCDANCIDALDRIWRWIVGLGAVPPAVATLVRWFIPESPRYTMEVEKDPERAKRDVQRYFPESSARSQPGQDRDAEMTIGSASSTGGLSTAHTEPTMVFGDPVELQELALAEPALPLPADGQKARQALMRKETWREYWTGLWQFMIVEGNWTDLAGTSLAWLALDFAFYCLSVNNPNILNKLWRTEAGQPVYQSLVQNAYRALIAVSIGSLVGGYLFIVMSRYRWALQYYGFLVLTGGFIVVGVCYMTLLNTRYFAAVIVLYSLCSLFFNLGPNTSTYAISAEVFPTKYRCTCAGISAAAGKLGSIVAQVFLTYVKFGPSRQGVFTQASPYLGAVLLIFTVWMVAGAITTKVWVPNPVDVWGRSRTLEDLGQGKAERKRMERDETQFWQAFTPASPGA